ncbi:MAG: cytochrome c oxidase assembly protein [bacterium]|nr:cytochrome c oxidase assembly protein [bacterium]
MALEHALDHETRRKNARLAGLLLLLLAFMGVFAWALVPLYRLICERYGIGAIPQRPSAVVLPTAVGDRNVDVRFIGITASGTPASIEPVEEKATVRLGETRVVSYRFVNETDRSRDFVAVHSVVPARADKKFHKIQCFCFEKLTLKPHETRIEPIQFWVDPTLDSETREITLQYTLYATQPGESTVPPERS